MEPGATVLTRMFFFAASMARLAPRLISAALAALYEIGPPVSRPKIEEMWTMLPPPRASIKGIAARLTRTAERKLKLMMSFHSASSISTKGVHFDPPTLFTRISSPPKRLFAASTTAIAPSGVVTSCAMASTSVPPLANSAAASASVSAPRAQMQSRAPSAAKATAMRLPIPRLAPVTKATLSLSPRSKLHSFFNARSQCSGVGRKKRDQISNAQRQQHQAFPAV